MPSDSSLPITLRIMSPSIAHPDILCDSVRLTVADNEKGRGGGSCGIKKGHAPALIALSEGKVSAYRGNEEIFSRQTKGGFASVENNIVTLIIA